MKTILSLQVLLLYLFWPGQSVFCWLFNTKPYKTHRARSCTPSPRRICQNCMDVHAPRRTFQSSAAIKKFLRCQASESTLFRPLHCSKNHVFLRWLVIRMLPLVQEAETAKSSAWSWRTHFNCDSAGSFLESNCSWRRLNMRFVCLDRGWKGLSEYC